MQRVINVGDLVVTIKYRRKMKNIYLKVYEERAYMAPSL